MWRFSSKTAVAPKFKTPRFTFLCQIILEKFFSRIHYLNKMHDLQLFNHYDPDFLEIKQPICLNDISMGILINPLHGDMNVYSLAFIFIHMQTNAFNILSCYELCYLLHDKDYSGAQKSRHRHLIALL